MKQKNLIELDLERIKTIQMNLLKKFICFCDNNNIFYSVAYGTLLGAIRHNGYIPWDDDIDVMIFRKDVKKILLEFDSSECKVISNEKDSSYFSPLIKIYDSNTVLIQNYGQVEKKNIGVYIDVFILDSVPFDDTDRKKIFAKAEKMRFYWAMSCRSFLKKGSNFIRQIGATIYSIPFKLIGYRHFAKKYNDYCANSCSKTGYYAVLLYGEGYIKEPILDDNDLRVELHKFEGLHVNIIKSYDKYLKSIYNNYMVFPEESQRISKHNYKVFIKENKK